MATVEHAMWVTKRYPALRNEMGFVMVPAALRATLVADGGAQDVFDFRAFPDSTPLGPAITDIAFAPVPVATDAAVGTVAGTLTVDGGTAPFVFALTGPDAENFSISAAQVKTAVTPLREGVHEMYVTASDAGGRRFIDPLTVTVTAAPPLAARKTASKK
jgi:hypothetical protein